MKFIPLVGLLRIVITSRLNVDGKMVSEKVGDILSLVRFREYYINSGGVVSTVYLLAYTGSVVYVTAFTRLPVESTTAQSATG